MHKRENPRQFFVCRGLELLTAKRQAKCHISSFSDVERHIKPITWTRVCKVHEIIDIPINRVIIVRYEFVLFIIMLV